MRRVDDEADLADAIASARRESRAAFGDDTLLLERYIENPQLMFRDPQVLSGCCLHGGAADAGRRERFPASRCFRPLFGRGKSRYGSLPLERKRPLWRGSGRSDAAVLAKKGLDLLGRGSGRSVCGRFAAELIEKTLDLVGRLACVLH